VVVPGTRVRILVSGGVVIVISVKLYVIKSVAATFVAARTLPENCRFPTSSDQSKKWSCAQPTMLPSQRISGFSLPAFTCNLSFLSNYFTLWQ
jgi:hypothetical protein